MNVVNPYKINVIDNIYFNLFENYYFNTKKSMRENFYNLLRVAFTKDFADKRLNNLIHDSENKTIILEIDCDTNPSTAKHIISLLLAFLDEYEGYLNLEYFHLKVDWC